MSSPPIGVTLGIAKEVVKENPVKEPVRITPLASAALPRILMFVPACHKLHGHPRTHTVRGWRKTGLLRNPLFFSPCGPLNGPRGSQLGSKPNFSPTSLSSQVDSPEGEEEAAVTGERPGDVTVAGEVNSDAKALADNWDPPSCAAKAVRKRSDMSTSWPHC